MYWSACSRKILADCLPSKKSEAASSTSCLMISLRPLVTARILAGCSNCITYLNVVCDPTYPRCASASCCSEIPSVTALMAMISTISDSAYGKVRIIRRRSNRSGGIPCGDWISVPLIVVCPRLVANMTIGLSVDSKALLRKVKHSCPACDTSS